MIKYIHQEINMLGQRIASVIGGTDIDTNYPIRIPQDAFEVSF
jgi:hypothetical protein